MYSPHEVFGRADLLPRKLPAPCKEEIEMMRLQAPMLMGLLHLAATRQERIEAMQKNQITRRIAYEEIREPEGDNMPMTALG